MQLTISILSVTQVAHPTKTPGKTTPKLDLAYKNLSFQGKVEGKALFSFGDSAEAFKTLSAANPGDIFDIEYVKSADGKFNNWVSAKKSDGSAVASQASPASTGKPAYSTAPKSNYPTDEERAKTQIYIVRQSNLAQAINLLSVGAKTPPKVDDVIATAKVFEDHVFGTSVKPAEPAAKPFEATDFDDLDDLPQ